MEELELESVLELARGHDADALAELYRRYAPAGPSVLCRYLLGSTETARGCDQRSLPQAAALDRQFTTASVPFPRLAAARG